MHFGNLSAHEWVTIIIIYSEFYSLSKKKKQPVLVCNKLAIGFINVF